MFRICLVSINNTNAYGFRCLSSHLKNNGFEVYSIFFGIEFLGNKMEKSEDQYQSLEDILRNLQPDLVGISALTFFYHPIACRIASTIKSISEIPVVLGGVHPTLMPGFCLEEAPFDYICIGEGEESMTELCRRLSGAGNDDDDDDEIAGIMSRQSKRHIRRNPPCELDALPFQDIGDEGKFFILFDGSVIEGDPVKKFPVPYATRCTRGCPFKCSYCANASIQALYEPGTYIRSRSPENVITEIKSVLEQRSCPPYIFFIDDTFPSDADWVEDFAERYSDIELPFRIWLNPNMTDDRNIAALKSAGLKEAVLGIESGSDITRKDVFLRHESRKAIKLSHEILLKHQIDVRYDFIIEHEWESPTELEETFELLSSLRRPYSVSMHNLVVFPGTTLARRAVAEGSTTGDELVQNLLDDIDGNLRKIYWNEGGTPRQQNLKRAYWLFLIMSLGNPAIPKWLTDFLSNRAIYRRHPELLIGSKTADMRKSETRLKKLLIATCFKSPFLQKRLNGIYPVKSANMMMKIIRSKPFQAIHLFRFLVRCFVRYTTGLIDLKAQRSTSDSRNSYPQ